MFLDYSAWNTLNTQQRVIPVIVEAGPAVTVMCSVA